jgi:hypothetical protein
MWEPQPLTTLRASTACTGIILPLLLPYYKIKNLLLSYSSFLVLDENFLLAPEDKQILYLHFEFNEMLLIIVIRQTLYNLPV